jgi:hypothetical protein
VGLSSYSIIEDGQSITLGYTLGYLQVRGIDNYLPISLLAVCEYRAGTWVKEKGSRLKYT